VSLLPFLCLTLFGPALTAEVKQISGGAILPHQRYIHAVPESDSPVQQAYIKSKDGLYVAAAMRKPKGEGPFPVLIHFHGAPGGRGMEKLVTWSRGDSGSPFFERFLQEGYVVVVADYRGGQNFNRLAVPPPPDTVTYADDAVAVVEHVRTLPYADKTRIFVYGVSLGGDVTMHLISRTKVRAAILGAGAPLSFLGARGAGAPGSVDRFKTLTVNEAAAQERIARIECPLLIQVGTKDALLPLDRALYEQMEKGGRKVTLEIYENGYHDFVMGPQGHPGREEPLMDITLAALESSLRFFRESSK
jgi:dipeptidyl aminopeptidase/acylaminoacyl peptidase